MSYYSFDKCLFILFFLLFVWQVPSSPPPLAAPIARRLSVSASVAGEEGLMSCVLPEELLVEILAERLQVSYSYDSMIVIGSSKIMMNAQSAILTELCLHLPFIDLYFS